MAERNMKNEESAKIQRRRNRFGREATKGQGRSNMRIMEIEPMRKSQEVEREGMYLRRGGAPRGQEEQNGDTCKINHVLYSGVRCVNIL